VTELCSKLKQSNSTSFHEQYLQSEAKSLINFATGSLLPTGGFGYLNSDGTINESKDLELWINCRMTQVFGLATAAGFGDYTAETKHGIESLLKLFEDKQYGGFFNSVSVDGTVINGNKLAYDQAFVLLAASTGVALNISSAVELFSRIDSIIDEHYWDDKFGMLRNEWNREFTHLDTYRGINANMHAVESFCAAYEVTKDKKFLDRAYLICKRAVDEFARENNWLLPEHFDSNWKTLKEFNIDNPTDPFLPYGVTIGHLFEWARLILQLELLLDEDPAHAWIRTGATAMYEVAAKYGWSADGSAGFIYTMDWDTTPIVRSRMHWVGAEAVMTAFTLWTVTDDDKYLADYDLWWNYIDTYVIDKKLGSWHSELDPNHSVSEVTWPGKPDVYHAFNACLLPMFPMKTSFIGTFIN
jgi:sulfoquinovose isomerase